MRIRLRGAYGATRMRKFKNGWKALMTQSTDKNLFGLPFTLFLNNL
jgi:hypothetical protein